MSDADKFAMNRFDGSDLVFDGMQAAIDGGVYDPLSAALMRWYLAEERDSIRILLAARDRVVAGAAT